MSKMSMYQIYIAKIYALVRICFVYYLSERLLTTYAVSLQKSVIYLLGGRYSRLNVVLK